MKRLTIFLIILLLLAIPSFAQFGGNSPFPDNILIRNNGSGLTGTGKIIDLRTNISATYDSLTNSYHFAAAGEATPGNDT